MLSFAIGDSIELADDIMLADFEDDAIGDDAADVPTVGGVTVPLLFDDVRLLLVGRCSAIVEDDDSFCTLQELL